MNKESDFRRMEKVAFILTKNATAYCTAQRKNFYFLKWIMKMDFRFHNEKRKF